MRMMASDLYGTAPVVIPALAPQTAVSATDDAPNGGLRSLVDIRNPLVWFAGIVLITVGAAGIAGSARVGPAKVTGSLGRS